ncbi:hypothetical protein C0991_001844 [Blastosporella zonata]|nr:hypothetical protein C0991_001844 [Blastosporella zonata]
MNARIPATPQHQVDTAIPSQGDPADHPDSRTVINANARHGKAGRALLSIASRPTCGDASTRSKSARCNNGDASTQAEVEAVDEGSSGVTDRGAEVMVHTASGEGVVWKESDGAVRHASDANYQDQPPRHLLEQVQGLPLDWVLLDLNAEIAALPLDSDVTAEDGALDESQTSPKPEEIVPTIQLVGPMAVRHVFAAPPLASTDSSSGSVTAPSEPIAPSLSLFDINSPATSTLATAAAFRPSLSTRFVHGITAEGDI